MFSIIIIFLIPFLTYASEERRYFESIQSAVESLQSREQYYAIQKACYPDIGCFSTDGLLKHIGILPSTPTKIGTKFFVYTHEAHTTSKEIKVHDATSFGVITNTKPLVIVIHGFGNNEKTPQISSIKDSLLKFANIPTVIMVDWAAGAKEPWYPEAAVNTELVGREVAFLVENLRTKHSVDPKDVHLIGFSLGAQVAGFAGKYSQSEYKWKFGRISALDSAAPLFEGYVGSFLNHNDAIFVDAIHTSAGNSILQGNVGFIHPIGHVDFFPHNGTKQPRCEDQTIHISCNHYSSTFYYEASLSGGAKCQFTAYKCPDWADFIAKKCAKNGDSRMGYYSISQSGKGSHYLEVNKDYPFCQN